MAEDLESTLSSWGIAPHWIDRIKDEEVFDLETLIQLPEIEVDRIVTKAGPRAMLKAKIKELIESVMLTEDDLVKIAKEIIISSQKLANLPLCAKASLSVTASQQTNGNQANGQEVNGQRANSQQAMDQEGNGQQAMDQEGNGQQDDRQLINPQQDNETEDAEQTGNENSGNNRQGSSRVRTASSLLGKRPHKPSGDDTELKRLCRLVMEGKIVLNYWEEHGELNDDNRVLLAGVVMNDYLQDDYDKKFPVDEEKRQTDRVLKSFPNEKRNIWMAPEEFSRDTAAGRGMLLRAYYGKRRVMKKGGLLKKRSSAAATTSVNVEDLADIDGDVDPDEFAEKLLWLTNNKTLSPRLTEYWKFTSKGRLRKFMSEKIPITEYIQTYPALSEMTGYLLLESDFETLFEGASMQLYASWPSLAAFIESKVPKNVKAAIFDTFTPEGKKIKTIQALPYLFNVVTAAKKGKNKQWRPSREESAESILLHVLDTPAILTTLANRLKEKYEPFNLSLGPQAIVVGETVDSITKSYVRVNSVLYEVDNPIKAVDIAFKIMHALDCQYPKESEREWFFLERSVYAINTNKKNPLTVKTSSVCNDFSSFQS